ncbi:telomerase reverse transcriptase/ribonuclease HI, partial [Trypanosoma cruzi]
QHGPLRNSSQHGTPIAVSVANSCLRVATTEKVSKPPSTIHPRNISQQATEDSMVYGVKGPAEVNQHQQGPMGSVVELIANTALLGKAHLEIVISIMLHFVCQVCQLHRRGTHTTICILVGVWRPHPKQSLQYHFLSNLTHNGSKADGSI